MNFGTKLRTVLRIATSLQTALCMTTAVITDFNNKSLILVWAIFSIACDFVIAFITTYYNNDYTEIACETTGELRARKAEQKGIQGEYFYSDEEEVPGDE